MTTNIFTEMDMIIVMEMAKKNIWIRVKSDSFLELTDIQACRNILTVFIRLRDFDFSWLFHP
jgi:hypothetical protein